MFACEQLFNATGFLISSAAGFAVIAVSSWLFGETLLERLSLSRRPLRWALAATVGLGLISQSMFVLGLLGLLQRGVVVTLLLLGHVACHRTWRSLASARWSPPYRWRRLALWCGVGTVVAAPFYILALYPPTGFDATVYHLPYARFFIEGGRLAFLPDLRFPVFPQAGELVFTLAFLLSGEIAAKLTQLWAMILTAGLLVEWGRQWPHSRLGVWAAALWLGNPLVAWLGASAYVDISLTLYVTAALYAWSRWDQTSDRRWLWLTGAMIGMAAATKYLGLFFCAALGVLILVRATGKRQIRPLLIFCTVALAIMAPWYLRIVYHTGNPVFPFYAPIFGASEWASFHDHALAPVSADGGAGATGLWDVITRQTARVGEGLGFLLRVPWTAIFDRGLFNWQAPVSPFYLFLLPLGAPLALFEKGSRRLLILVMIYGLFWLTTIRDLRFLIAIVPALNIILVAAFLRGSAIRSFFNRKKSAALLVSLVLLAPGWAYAGYKIWERGRPPMTPQERGGYLNRQVPGHEAIQALNEREGADYTVYTLYGPFLRYYAEGRFLGDWFGPARFSRVTAVLGDGRALHAELRGLGADYFLVRRLEARALMPSDDAFFRRGFRLEMEGADYVLYRLLDADG